MRATLNRLILLVEDNPKDEELTLRALTEAKVPADVRVARDGAEALDCLLGAEKLRPDLLLLDIRLPKYSGLEVLQKIRQEEDLRSMPVVMLTSSDDKSDIDLSYKYGANSFIRKDVDVERYLEDVRLAGIYWTTINIAKRHQR